MARSRRPAAVARGGALEQLADLVARKEVRQVAALPRIAQRTGGVGLRPAFALAKAKEAAQRSQPPRNRRLGVAGLLQVRKVTAEIEAW